MAGAAKRALVILATGSDGMETVIIADVLRQGGIDVTLAGLTGADMVECSQNVMMKPDISLDEALTKGPYDAVVLPGGATGAETLAQSETVAIALTEHFASGKLIAAIGIGPVVFPPHGIGLGKKITSHYSVMDRFAGYQYVGDRVVRDGNLITSQGPGTAVEFGLILVEILIGEATVCKLWQELDVRLDKMDQALLWKLMFIEQTVVSLTGQHFIEYQPFVNYMSSLGHLYLDIRLMTAVIGGEAVVPFSNLDLTEFRIQAAAALYRVPPQTRLSEDMQLFERMVSNEQPINLQTLALVYQQLAEKVSTTKWKVPWMIESMANTLSSVQCKRLRTNLYDNPHVWAITPRVIALELISDFKLPEAVEAAIGVAIGVAGAADPVGLEPPPDVDRD